MSIWVNGKKKIQYVHIQLGKCMAWVGLGLQLGCEGVSLHVYLQGPGSECGWVRLILHQRLKACIIPGGATTLHVSLHSTLLRTRVERDII